MGNPLHWVEGPWPGKLALAARPRGDDWLPDELAGWQRVGVDTVYSLLTSAEEQALDLTNERSEAGLLGLRYESFEILDREVPDSPADLAKALDRLESHLN